MVAYSAVELGEFAFALAVLVAWECYLRVSEVARLRVVDVVFEGPNAVLVLVKTKTGKRKLQLAVVRDRRVVRLLRIWTAGRNRADSLFGMSKFRLRTRLKQYLSYWRLEACEFVFHSIRHGRATQDAADGVEVKTIMNRGRWKALKSVENYLQQGRAIMIKNVEACRRIVALGSSIEAVFEVVFSLGFPAQ